MSAFTPAKIRASIRRTLTAPARVTTSRREITGRLDRRALVGAKLGRTDVMVQRRLYPARDCTVALYLDCSGSMGDVREAKKRGTYRWTKNTVYRWDKVATAAFWIALAVQQSGARLHVAHWSSFVRPVLSPGQRLTPAHLENFRDRRWIGGGTEGALAVHDATLRLSAERTARRVLIVMTDGESNDTDALPYIIADAERAGIEVHVIGLECYASQYWPKRVTRDVLNLADLPKVLGEILAPGAA